jgi:hypothetical protein
LAGKRALTKLLGKGHEGDAPFYQQRIIVAMHKRDAAFTKADAAGGD